MLYDASNINRSEAKADMPHQTSLNMHDNLAASIGRTCTLKQTFKVYEFVSFHSRFSHIGGTDSWQAQYASCQYSKFGDQKTADIRKVAEHLTL